MMLMRITDRGDCLQKFDKCLMNDEDDDDGCEHSHLKRIIGNCVRFIIKQNCIQSSNLPIANGGQSYSIAWNFLR